MMRAIWLLPMLGASLGAYYLYSGALVYRNTLGDEIFAQYMLKYVRAASRCSPYTESDLERAMIPALGYIATPDEMSTAIAFSGDIAAREGDRSIDEFSRIVRVMIREAQKRR